MVMLCVLSVSPACPWSVRRRDPGEQGTDEHVVVLCIIADGFNMFLAAKGVFENGLVGQGGKGFAASPPCFAFCRPEPLRFLCAKGDRGCHVLNDAHQVSCGLMGFLQPCLSDALRSYGGKCQEKGSFVPEKVGPHFSTSMRESSNRFESVSSSRLTARRLI